VCCCGATGHDSGLNNLQMNTTNNKSFRPGELWPDNHGVHINAHGGGILFHDGIYYWFGEHKIAGAAGNLAHVGVHVYSSRDLYNWRDEGIALQVSDDPAAFWSGPRLSSIRAQKSS
jgi:hypothetical protein